MEDIKVRRVEIKKLRDLEEKEDKIRLQKAQREREDQEEKRKRYILQESILIELNAEILEKPKLYNFSVKHTYGGPIYYTLAKQGPKTSL